MSHARIIRELFELYYTSVGFENCWKLYSKLAVSSVNVYFSLQYPKRWMYEKLRILKINIGPQSHKAADHHFHLVVLLLVY
ncbi:hypothetical protein EG68_05989 [Paragonimus skrjabini miyazakii]|uniref:Uncharacterized protein n=1 Tax=Paragonimus skrjabini miyazakii TaxID=59628 RepID=A0A8S9YP95_9TREM|nr:hypothetical protein EG68_05989 [Paragonimus skrjabini miyazakii]